MDTHEPRNDDHPRSHGGAEVALLPHQLAVVQELEFRPEDVCWERKPGQIELNPLLLARIAERIQFDGDVPELRHGNLPEGGKPAVPVAFETTDSVLLGHMLQRARLEVTEGLQNAQQQWELGIVEKGELATDVVPVWSVPGYTPGQLPVPRKLGYHQAELCRLTNEEKHEAAFTAIASTQGRVSSVPAIFRLIREGLEARGLQVLQGKGEGPPVSTSQWTMGISQAKAHNPRFSPAATAAAAMLGELVRSVPEDLPSCKILVQAVNTIHEREVGWKVTLYG